MIFDTVKYWFSKWQNKKKILILQIVKFGKFVNFFNWAGMAALRNWLIFQIRHCWNFQNSKIVSIGKLTNFQNFTTWKTNKFSEFFKFRKLSKFKKLANFGIVCPFDIPHYSQFCRFSYLPFDINELRRFIFWIFIFYCTDSRKFGCSTFEHSLIFKFEMLAILKFDCSKF